MVEIESTGFPSLPKTFVFLKFRLKSFLKLINNIPRFTSPFFFFVFICLFRLQRKPFVQREGVDTILCLEPMMIITYKIN